MVNPGHVSEWAEALQSQEIKRLKTLDPLHHAPWCGLCLHLDRRATDGIPTPAPTTYLGSPTP
jgi:hypothetical protein